MPAQKMILLRNKFLNKLVFLPSTKDDMIARAWRDNCNGNQKCCISLGELFKDALLRKRSEESKAHSGNRTYFFLIMRHVVHCCAAITATIWVWILPFGVRRENIGDMVFRQTYLDQGLILMGAILHSRTALKLNFHTPILACCDYCESVICMEFSLQKYRPRANINKKNYLDQRPVPFESLRSTSSSSWKLGLSYIPL